VASALGVSVTACRVASIEDIVPATTSAPSCYILCLETTPLVSYTDIAMSSYCYVSLPKELGNIRLLRLIPDQDDTAIIQCELFQYSLSLQSSRSTHLYEALSYVWGDPGKTLPIIIHGKAFNVTANLHAALLQLRNHSIERILWVDAICIDQDNQAEKEHQIGYMADIYGQANRVLVWLGKAADDSDLAFEEMRHFRGKGDMTVMEMQRLESASLALLQRPWFQRIWVS
jgi:hypothetical protein